MVGTPPLSGIVLSPHGQLLLIWFARNPSPPTAHPVITGGHHAAQGMPWNHQRPARMGSVLRGCV